MTSDSGTKKDFRPLSRLQKAALYDCVRILHGRLDSGCDIQYGMMWFMEEIKNVANGMWPDQPTEP